MINPIYVMREVEDYFHLYPGALLERNRCQTTSKARAVAMYLVKNLCGRSYHEVGDLFQRDHSSVVQNCKRVIRTISESKQDIISCAIIKLSATVQLTDWD